MDNNDEPGGLSLQDFGLTADELALLNRYAADRAARHAEAGEEPASGIRVAFDFGPFGRTVTAYFDGAVNGIDRWRHDRSPYNAHLLCTSLCADAAM